MKALIMLPIVLGIILTTAMSLQEFAESSSEKAIDFADDMNNAFSCAALGKSIFECSPDLKTTDFTNETIKAKELIAELEENLDDANQF
ncbi:MAG: hypothetical protein H6502_01040 [Candidatus Woesearchaeota archaeon]|nr:MAG: hypothetical protein H6502_01040 [Candidatus Woesearchaeota archaeon]